MTEDWTNNLGIIALLLCVIAWATFAIGWYLAANSYMIFPGFLLASIPIGVAAIFVGWKASAASDRLGLFARTGMILGCFWALALLGSVFSATGYIGVHPRVEVSRARSDLTNLAVALEQYIADHETYPPAVDGSGKMILSATGEVSAGYVPWLLTTPVAYIEGFPIDPFSPSKEERAMPYRYATNGTGCWILATNGPDKKADADVADYPSPEGAGCTWERFAIHFGIGTALEYDPTNGDRSRGDIMRVEP
jgi:hypothetical protein